MWKILLLLAAFHCLTLGDEIKETAEENLWNHAIKMEKVVASVQYKGRQINVWHDDTHNRYYAYPLCVVEMSSMKCSVNEFLTPARHVLLFTVRLWDPLIKEVVSLELKQQKREFEDNNVIVLPMQMVRLDSRSGMEGNFEINKRWRSFQNQPSKISFEILVKDAKYCQKLLNDSQSDPEAFFTKTDLEFQFTMIAEQQSTRGVNITFEAMKKSKLLSEMKNFYEKLNNSSSAGSVYLNSKDINNLARELISTATANTEQSSEYKETESENNLLNGMIEQMYEDKVDIKNLLAEDLASVFWDDTFARPDKLSSYLNEVFEYKDDDKRFHLDQQKDDSMRAKLEKEESSSSYGKGGGNAGVSIFGIGVNAGGYGESGESNSLGTSNDTTKIDKKAFSLDDFNKLVKEKNLHVEWNGEVFIPKSMDLHRININDLYNENKVIFNKMITTKLRSSQKAPLIPDTDAAPSGADPISPVYYQELMEKYLSLTTSLKPQVNTIIGQLRNISQNVEFNNGEITNLKQQIKKLQNP